MTRRHKQRSSALAMYPLLLFLIDPSELGYADAFEAVGRKWWRDDAHQSQPSLRRRRPRFSSSSFASSPTVQTQQTGVIPSSSSSSSSSSRIEKILHFMEILLKDKDAIYTRQGILNRINQRHEEDCHFAASRLAVEDISHACSTPSIGFVDICTATDQYRLACQSLAPLLNASSIEILRHAAEHRWHATPPTDDDGITAKTTSSRFTYQRPGNYEAHVSELGPQACAILNHALVEQIYPMIRRRFWNETTKGERLCVYDALYIRYNATEAPPMMGASQPLHRDLGIVSVNIMLNDADEFTGGGTFFENQLRDENDTEDPMMKPLRPSGVGYALAHYSSERHAGAATRRGVRDILVCFITAMAQPAPALVQAALCKQSRDACCINANDDDDENDILQQQRRTLYCRLLHQTTAVRANPADGEAWQYLANTLLEYADSITSESNDISTGAKAPPQVLLLTCAQQALEEAVALTPCDARVWNTIARTLGRLQTNHRHDSSEFLQLEASVRGAYNRGIALLERTQKVGCQVQGELDAVRLNYGLHLANQDLFAEAAIILEPVAAKHDTSASSAEHRILADAYSLWRMCEQYK